MADPVFGIRESTHTDQKQNYRQQLRNKGVSFSVQADDKRNGSAGNRINNTKTNKQEATFERRPLKCAVCDNEHPVYRCDEFKTLSPQDRVKMAAEKHLLKIRKAQC